MEADEEDQGEEHPVIPDITDSDKTTSPSTKPHICEKCGKSYLSRFSLRKHIKTIHLGEYKYRCEKCDRNFISITDYNLHQQSPYHLGLKKFKCRKCSRYFKEQANLDRHAVEMPDCDNRVKLAKCELCSKEFATIYTLKKHVFAMHVKNRDYRCPQCDKTFQSGSGMKTHVKLCKGPDAVPAIGAGSKRIQILKCKGCGEKFRSKPVIREHQESCKEYQLLGETDRLTCDRCNSTFSDIRSLNRHIQHIHLKKFDFRCEKCNMNFRRQYEMDRHCKSARHLGLIKRVKCDDCKRYFDNQEGLDKHRERFPDCAKEYENRIMFPCKHCGKEFDKRSSRARHAEAVHHHLYECSCHICGKVLTRPDILKVHLIRVHKVDPSELKGMYRRPKYVDDYEDEKTTPSRTKKKEKRRKKPVDFVKPEYELGMEEEEEDFEEFYENETNELDPDYRQFLKEEPNDDHFDSFEPFDDYDEADLDGAATDTGAKIKGDTECEFCDMSFETGDALANHVLASHNKDIMSVELDEIKVKQEEVIADENAPPAPPLDPEVLNSSLDRSMDVKVEITQFDEPDDIAAPDNVDFEEETVPETEKPKIKKSKKAKKKRLKLTKEDLKIRRKEREGGKTHMCEQCGSVFKYKADMERHVMERHLNQYNFRCEKCDMGFRHKKELERHEKTPRHNGEVKSVKCHKCLRYYKNLEQLARHTEANPNCETTVKEPRCEECGKMFNSRSTLLRHVSIIHRGNVHTCPVCQTSFSRRLYLIKHYEKTPQCKQQSGWRPEDELMAKVKPESYMCDHCGRSYNTQSDLKKHVDFDHLNISKYFCEKCNVKCRTKNHYERHVNSLRHRGLLKTNRCEDCGRVFRDQFKLDKHRSDMPHCKELPSEEYPCQQCDKMFQTRQGLIRHEDSVHLQLKPFACHNCDKGYARREYLVFHLKNCHQNSGGDMMGMDHGKDMPSLIRRD